MMLGATRGAVLERLDARLKIIFLLAYALIGLLLDRPAALATLFGLSLVAAGLARPSLSRLGVLVLAAGLITWGTMLSQAIFFHGQPRTVLVALPGGLELYLEGFRHGAVQSLRFSGLLILSLTLCWTTDPAEMIRGLTRLKVPYVLAFMAVTALRFLPVVLRELAAVRLALARRGGRLIHLDPVRTILAWLKIMRPVFINCLRRSNTLALAIQSRAFSPAGRRSSDLGRGWTWGERSLAGLILGLVAGLALVKLAYWLYLTGLFYRSALRPVYEFCRLYL